MLLVIIIIAIIFVVRFQFYLNHKLQLSGFHTEEEIITLFEKNEKVFVNVANDLNDYQSNWSIKKEYQSRYDFKSQNIGHGLYVIIHEEPYDELSFIAEQLEHNKEIREILKTLYFKSIRRMPRLDENSIYFIKQTSINYEAGIVYSPNQAPTSQYITKLTAIDNNWYYYESK